MNQSDVREAGKAFEELVRIIDKLRSPGGCPWDREQTHQSLKPMMIEEAYEAVEAIDRGDDEELAGELGDLLLQVVFHSRIAIEDSRFSITDVIRQVTEKMVRRHPHVFAHDKAETADDVLRSWEAIKAAEIAAKGKAAEDGGSMLDSVSRGLPAVMEAYQMTTKVSRVGFDWPDVAGVLEKLEEEAEELKAATRLPEPSHSAVYEEVGDLLFAVVNVARLLGVDPESALKASNRKFRRRFRHIEDRLREQGRKPADSNLEEMDGFWDEAKRIERTAESPAQPYDR
jgi:tetrapyrrole methylase family protein/MazG family protein